MSNLLPAESLINGAVSARPVFDLGAPNPVLGKTVFLRLPLGGEWNCEVNPADLVAGRNLILRDQMWVTEGEARFVAVHQSGTRVEVAVKIKAWKPGARRDAGDEEARGKPPDARRQSRSLLGRLSGGRRSETRLTIRCRSTERQIEIRWERDGIADLELLLANAQCH